MTQRTPVGNCLKPTTDATITTLSSQITCGLVVRRDAAELRAERHENAADTAVRSDGHHTLRTHLLFFCCSADATAPMMLSAGGTAATPEDDGGDMMELRRVL